MNPPLVSIGLPVYNGEKTIERALESILSQNFEDFELILCDNASTDRTEEICRDFERRDRRIRYFRHTENIGVRRNHNRVFDLGKGEYFQWFAHDLVAYPDLLQRCTDYMRQADPSVVLVYPRWDMVDPTGKPTGSTQAAIAREGAPAHARLYRVITRIIYVTQLFGLSRSEVLRKTRLFDTFPSSDYVLLAEMAMLGEIREIPEVLFQREMDPDRGTLAVVKDPQKWRSWLDPQAARRRTLNLLSRQQKLSLEYARSSLRLPLKPADKLRCMAVGGAGLYWRDMLRVTGPFRHACRRLFKS